MVLLQGVLGDGDLGWQRVVPHLTGRFTCHLPSMRGRGRSDDHPNVMIDWLAGDYAAYVESLGEPAGLVGWSAGAGHALAVSARCEAVFATALYEPIAGMSMDAEERADLLGALASGSSLVEQGDLPAAIRAIASFPLTPDDLAAAGAAGYLEGAGTYAPHVLRFFRQAGEYDGPMPEDSAVLGAISAPVLYLHGTETNRIFDVGAQHTVNHVPDARGHAVSGAGHAGPLTHPGVVAGALTEFFDAAFTSD